MLNIENHRTGLVKVPRRSGAATLEVIRSNKNINLMSLERTAGR